MFCSLKNGMDKELRVLVVNGSLEEKLCHYRGCGYKCSEVKTKQHQEKKMLLIMVTTTPGSLQGSGLQTPTVQVPLLVLSFIWQWCFFWATWSSVGTITASSSKGSFVDHREAASQALSSVPGMQETLHKHQQNLWPPLPLTARDRLMVANITQVFMKEAGFERGLWSQLRCKQRILNSRSVSGDGADLWFCK